MESIPQFRFPLPRLLLIVPSWKKLSSILVFSWYQYATVTNSMKIKKMKNWYPWLNIYKILVNQIQEYMKMFTHQTGFIVEVKVWFNTHKPIHVVNNINKFKGKIIGFFLIGIKIDFDKTQQPSDKILQLGRNIFQHNKGDLGKNEKSTQFVYFF